MVPFSFAGWRGGSRSLLFDLFFLRDFLCSLTDLELDLDEGAFYILSSSYTQIEPEFDEDLERDLDESEEDSFRLCFFLCLSLCFFAR